MLTVILSTYNGAERLPHALTSFRELISPQNSWKLVIVDNGSTDRTHAVIQEFQNDLPITYLYYPIRGKNGALNLALNEVEGELVVFTDDDVIADPDWLLSVENGAAKYPEYDIFGGRIRPSWPAEPPEWLGDIVPLPIVYAITPDTMGEGPVNPGLVWGPNMAVRRRVFDAGHRFAEDVGPGPGQYRMGSETEFTHRMERSGYKSFFLAQANVQHLIRKNQLNPEWIVRRAYRFGRDMFWKENSPDLQVQDRPRDRQPPKVLGLPRWCYGSLLSAVWQRARAALSKDAKNRLKVGWELFYWAGYFREAFGPGTTLRRSLK